MQVLSHYSSDKLLHRDPLVERVFGIEQQCEGFIAVQRNLNPCHVADFALIGNRTNGAFAGFEYVEADDIPVRQDGAFPTARAKRANRRKREQRRIEWQDRAVCRQVICGRSRWRCDQYAVTDKLGDHGAIVD